MLFTKYLFDIDGVLVDTTEIQYNSVRKAIIQLYNYDINTNPNMIEIFKSAITTKDKLQHLSTNIDIDIDLVYNLKKQIADIEFNTISDDPIKKELFAFLKEKCKIGVVTNANKRSTNLILKNMGIHKYIDCLITNEDVKNTKPHSEPYIKAMMALGGNVEDYIIFEDSEVGIESAKGTGAFVHIVKSYLDINLDLIKYLNKINTTNVLIPMAGLGSRFTKRNFKTPKPLIKVGEKTLIELAIETLNIPGRYIFIIRKSEETERIRNLLKELKPDCIIIETKELTEGSASSCYLAKEYIDNHNELIISNCDQVLEWNHNIFLYQSRQENVDCSVLTHYSDNPKHSYIQMDDEGRILKIIEKEVISNNALVGVHYFKHGNIFIKSYEDIYKNKIKVKNEYYTSTICNNLIGTFKLGYTPLKEGEKYHSTGTPEDLFKYLEYTNRLNIKKQKITDMFRGWYVGNFEPSAYKTENFEVGYLLHKKGEQWDVHYHEHIKEVNLLIDGQMILNDMTLEKGDIFVINKGEIACPIFLTDCYIICIKIPSIIGDKICI